MFGHSDNDGTQQGDQSTSSYAEPVDDGTLGGPSSDGSAISPTSDTATTQTVPSEGLSMPAPYHEASTAPAMSSSIPAAADGPADSDSLIGIKQDALQQLKPLIGHLNQSPEEKFRTTMMMIQAADDQALISEAYAAAKAIPDDKIRAQALLDVVNEINYFTSQATNGQQ